MKTPYILFILIISSFFIVGCSTKEVFEPKNISGEWNKTTQLNSKIIQKATGVALLENNKVLIGDKTYDITIEKGFRLLGATKNYLLFTNINGILKLYNLFSKKTIQLSLKKTIAAASTDGDVIAVVFADGDLAIYSLFSKKLLLKLDGSASVALDSRIVNPYFMNDLILFLTLDGKVVIVNKKLKKRLRTIIVSATEYFNNVIFFDILQEKLIVATATKILSFGSSEQKADFEARNITHDNDNLYIATKQGDILQLSPDLHVKAKIHFPFAHFLALSVKGNKVYALEKEGYLIVLSKDLLQYHLYEVDLDNENIIYQGKDKIYINNKAIVLSNATDNSK